MPRISVAEQSARMARAKHIIDVAKAKTALAAQFDPETCSCIEWPGSFAQSQSRYYRGGKSKSVILDWAWKGINRVA